uniref:Uncharacterized protein n=1 Tax=Anguilla anguilla TaxID=7936 RepID=A0A0E9PKN8_ANGAN
MATTNIATTLQQIKKKKTSWQLTIYYLLTAQS